MPNDDFYIGWKDRLPRSYRRRMVGVVGLLVLAVVLVSSGLVLNQRPFSASVFEINRFTTLEGVLEMAPIPCLKLTTGTNYQGETQVLRVLLIGFGKQGATPTLQAIEKEQRVSLNNQSVKLEGKLIYFDGTPALELSRKTRSFQGFSKASTVISEKKELGKVSLFGEILDPKCYLGVMRPGEGKPHRSCAVRCIEGGIPALFRVVTPRGEDRQYFFLLDEAGNPISGLLSGFVADQVSMCGQVEKWDNWLVVKIDMKKGVQLVSRYQEASICR